jgi:ubiquinone/menaquinone biosynthesis C-methylase UbiE
MACFRPTQVCRGGIVAVGIVMAFAASSAAQTTAQSAEEINAQFLDRRMDPEDWAERFQMESREAFAARDAILKATGVGPGDEVADIGAGTGLYTALFARAVGPEGWVYAVDIAPKFIEYLATKLPEAGIVNVTPVLCTERSASLPPASVDVVFVCDTYHHFAHPQETLASIRSALRPGGRLVIVDFVREEGVSREWVLEHVRAGEATVRAEIEAAGFEFVAEPEVEGLEENYLVVFRRGE